MVTKEVSIGAGCSCEGGCGCKADEQGPAVDQLVGALVNELNSRMAPNPAGVIMAHEVLKLTTKRSMKLQRAVGLAKKKLAKKEAMLQRLSIDLMAEFSGARMVEIKLGLVNSGRSDLQGLIGGNDKTRAAAMDALTERESALVKRLQYKSEVAKEDLEQARLEVDMLKELRRLAELEVNRTVYEVTPCINIGGEPQTLKELEDLVNTCVSKAFGRARGL